MSLKQMTLFFICMGCHPPLEKDTPLFGEGGSSDPFTDLAGLPSLTNRINTQFCNDAADNLGGAVGATTYFTGTYIFLDGEWIGREKWLLFPNPYWAEIGGESCEVVWEMQATETELETCLACDLALFVSGELTEASTNCPEELWNDPADMSWTEIYEIAVIENDTLFYYQSGSELGEGYANEKAYSFLSAPDCKWF